MRVQLVELAPEWLSSGVSRGRMGFGFLCPACGRHRVEVWMAIPIDEGQPVTTTEGRRLYDVSGDSFETMEVHGAIPCGEDLLFVHEGAVVVG